MWASAFCDASAELFLWLVWFLREVLPRTQAGLVACHRLSLDSLLSVPVLWPAGAQDLPGGWRKLPEGAD